MRIFKPYVAAKWRDWFLANSSC